MKSAGISSPTKSCRAPTWRRRFRRCSRRKKLSASKCRGPNSCTEIAIRRKGRTYRSKSSIIQIRTLLVKNITLMSQWGLWARLGGTWPTQLWLARIRRSWTPRIRRIRTRFVIPRTRGQERRNFRMWVPLPRRSLLKICKGRPRTSDWRAIRRMKLHVPRPNISRARIGFRGLRRPTRRDPSTRDTTEIRNWRWRALSMTSTPTQLKARMATSSKGPLRQYHLRESRRAPEVKWRLN